MAAPVVAKPHSLTASLVEGVRRCHGGVSRHLGDGVEAHDEVEGAGHILVDPGLEGGVRDLGRGEGVHADRAVRGCGEMEKRATGAVRGGGLLAVEKRAADVPSRLVRPRARPLDDKLLRVLIERDRQRRRVAQCEGVDAAALSVDLDSSM